MSRKGKWIIILLVLGVVMFSIVQFIVIPKQNAAAEQYIIDQQRPLTHDLDYIIKYKHPYMGSAGNIIGLFYHLPMNVERDYELFSERLALRINYHQTVSEIGETIVHESLIYNSTAAFALVGNLEEIEYNFQGRFFIVKRENVEKLYQDFEQLITDKDIWNEKVRDPLGRKVYIEESLATILNE